MPLGSAIHRRRLRRIDDPLDRHDTVDLTRGLNRPHDGLAPGLREPDHVCADVDGSHGLHYDGLPGAPCGRALSASRLFRLIRQPMGGLRIGAAAGV